MTVYKFGNKIVRRRVGSLGFTWLWREERALTVRHRRQDNNEYCDCGSGRRYKNCCRSAHGKQS